MKSSGGSHPYKITFVNDEYVKYEIPETSGNYQNEIRNMFPDEIEDKIINYNSPENLRNLSDDIKKQVDDCEDYQSVLEK